MWVHMTDLTKFFGGSPFTGVENETRDPIQQLRDQMRHEGIEPPDHIKVDGQVHRFPTSDKRGDDSGWYVVFSDPIHAGSFGCWRSGLKCDWKESGRPMSLQESVQYREQVSKAQELARAERERKSDLASDVVESIWDSVPVASVSHPYLESHGIGAHGVKVTGDGRLVVPAFRIEGQGLKLVSAQYIGPDGSKRFHSSGAMGGAFWWVGDLHGASETVYIAEGFATAAAIHEATGAPCAVSFSAHNLPNTAKSVRTMRGTAVQLVVVADNDKGETGQFYASQAVASCGGRWVMPPEVGQDACDYRQSGGNLMELLEPKSSGFLVHWSEMLSAPAPMRWLLKSWVPRGCLGMVHGASGVGKSWFMIDAAMSVCSPKPEWHGKKARRGTVLYLAGEGHEGMKARLASWVKHHGMTPERDIWVSREGCNLDTPEGLALVQGEILALPNPPDLIVVDTLHRFMSGDENHSQDTGEMIDNCGRLQRDFGATVVLVHHRTNSGEARARGSSAWKGALEFEIGLSVDTGETVRVDCLKMKDRPEPEPVWFDLQSVDLGWVDEDGEPFPGAVAIECSKPVAEKRETETEQNLNLFERAWFDSGAEVVDGSPYVSRSGLKAFLEGQGMSDSQIKNALRLEPRRLIGGLVSQGMIDAKHHGWAVSDDATRLSFLVRLETS